MRLARPPVVQGVARAAGPRVTRRRVLGAPAAACSAGAALWLGAPGPPPAAARQEASAPRVGPYAVTDLGTLPDYASSIAYGISSRGRVVGAAYTYRQQPGGGVEYRVRAVLWDEGAIVDLGALDGLGPQDTFAHAVNGAGQVVGTAQRTGVQEPAARAFLWQDGAMVNLGVPAGYTSSGAAAVNDAGQIVGGASLARTTRRAVFLWEGGAIGILGGPAGQLLGAGGINAAGQVAGSYAPPDAPSTRRAALWRDGGIVDLGTLPGFPSSGALGVNDAGQVVCTADTGTGVGGSPLRQRAFVWQHDAVTDLGLLPGFASTEAYAINGAGVVVGRATDSASRAVHAVVWDGAAVFDLNALTPPDSGWTLSEARAINDLGQIAGSGQVGGQARAFLLTPQRGTAP